MLEVERAADLAPFVGRSLGVSDWLTVEQGMIDLFAQATGDDQWSHVDVERAARDMPEGSTIAHGYLTLSLLPLLARSIYRVRRASRRVNYGLNKARFTAPVAAGCRVRLEQTVVAVEPQPAGIRVTLTCRLEVEGQSRPALIAETITLVYD
jgi:acyl dehydratase